VTKDTPTGHRGIIETGERPGWWERTFIAIGQTRHRFSDWAAELAFSIQDLRNKSRPTKQDR
jgi:hypothetical protein